MITFISSFWIFFPSHILWDTMKSALHLSIHTQPPPSLRKKTPYTSSYGTPQQLLPSTSHSPPFLPHKNIPRNNPTHHSPPPPSRLHIPFHSIPSAIEPDNLQTDLRNSSIFKLKKPPKTAPNPQEEAKTIVSNKPCKSQL